MSILESAVVAAIAVGSISLVIVTIALILESLLRP